MKAIRFYGLVFLAAHFALSGCRMCSAPFDECGPVLKGGRPVCHSRARAGSILSHQATELGSTMQADEERLAALTGAQSESDFHAGLPDETSDASRPAIVGPPLRLEDIEPFVDLGIPPENIISVTDRPLAEVQKEKSPSVQAENPDESAGSSRPVARLAKPLKVLPSPEASEDGWMRLGSRAAQQMR